MLRDDPTGIKYLRPYGSVVTSNARPSIFSLASSDPKFQLKSENPLERYNNDVISWGKFVGSVSVSDFWG